MRRISIAMVGFGNVGRAFARLILNKQEVLEREHGLILQVTGIATGRHGMAIDPQGIGLEHALEVSTRGENLTYLSKTPQPASVLEFICQVPAVVLLENSPVNHLTGQPAVDHLRAALQRGMHAITANKGPVVHAFRELNQLAVASGRRFLFESTVMDGAPIFSLFRETLPGVVLQGFHGILNSCTNLILGRMEQGETFEQAVRYAQSIGITETDPSEDIDGWDASIKVALLVTVLMGLPLLPQQVEREGIRGITPQGLAEAKRAGERWKLVCSARREGSGVRAKVAPQRVRPDSPLYSINGTSSYVEFEMDVLPGLGIVENDPGPDTTAYGLLADLLKAVQE